MAFSCLFVYLGNRLIVHNAFSIFGSFVACRRLVDYCRACLAEDLVPGTGQRGLTIFCDIPIIIAMNHRVKQTVTGTSMIPLSTKLSTIAFQRILKCPHLL